ncbi:hypothetical protein BDY21DRAFT_384599 [Lineolata rhizophorae]|uniref:DUF1989 domain-containing protein n=1 Tax=Lineolata rhizophorae TaxID=578093 RepID=A0A6A6P6C7_9PEZI|nr:hypothetical protein BDY21DRAFT_384599 [Lineolata rhizophorae]
MSGEIQTIPARHGTATFVPRGGNIKIRNTYGRQCIAVWAFALHQPPEENPQQAEVEPQQDQLAQEKPGREGNGAQNEDTKTTSLADEKREAGEEGEGEDDAATEKTGEEVVGGKDATAKKVGEEVKDEGQRTAAKGDKEDPTSAVKEESEKPPTSSAADATSSAQQQRWSSYLPSWRSRGTPGPQAASAPPTSKGKPAKLTAGGLSSYLPSLPSTGGGSYLSRGTLSKEEQEAADKATSQRWKAYLPSGKGFSGYLPSRETLSDFMTVHKRDPSKSYAEQLYEFSKTPVGAAGISAATGSGTASSLYAAYRAYTPPSRSKPPMEYLSLPHTRAATKHVTPRPPDILYSNLRLPLLTLVSDTSCGAHDTLTGACDPAWYRELGVAAWAQHGSCAENLVHALRELNEKGGLRGANSVGADVTVNSVPAPLNLFMSAPWSAPAAPTKDGGQRMEGGEIRFEGPRGRKGEYVVLRAERDVVVVMSACPMDVLDINGGRSMVGHFVVEDDGDEPDGKEAEGIIKKAEERIRREQKAKAIRPPIKESQKVESPKRQLSGTGKPALTKTASSSSAPLTSPATSRRQSQTGEIRNSPKPGRNKPKKLGKPSTASQ